MALGQPMIGGSDRWLITPIAGGFRRIDLSESAVGTGRGLLVAAGRYRDVMDALLRSLGDEPVVDLQFKPSGVVIRPHTRFSPPHHRIAQVHTPLRFNSDDVERIRDQIAKVHPDIVVITGGNAATSRRDLLWATAIAAGMDPPTILALDIQQTPRLASAAGPGLSQRHGVDMYAAVRYSQYQATPGLNLYEATGVPIVGDGPLGEHATPIHFDVSYDRAVISDDAAEQPHPPRYVNSVVYQANSGVAVRQHEVLSRDTDYRLGIGIGPKRAESLLAGSDDAVLFPDKLFLARQARRVDVYLQTARGGVGEPKLRHLYLPVIGAAFTCPRADSAPADTDWDSFQHQTCMADHGELADFLVPRIPGIGVLELEVLLYVGAALVHRHRVQLATDPGTGCAAEVTFQLLHTFTNLPDLTDRKVSIAEGFDHLTINGVMAGAVTFTLPEAQWSGASFDVRTALTNLHFKKNIWRNYKPRYRLGTTSSTTFERLLHQLADSGSALFNSLFYTVQARGLVPMLRLEARGRDQPPVVEIARTVQRPFVLPWQAIYDLPLTSKPEICESVYEFGPARKNPDLPPPVSCPHEDKHPASDDPEASILCPWGFWGLAYLIEVPEPLLDRNMDESVTDLAGANEVLAAAGAGLDTNELNTHLRDLRTSVSGFPSTHLSRAQDLLNALADPADIVYVLCHHEKLKKAGRGSALMFADGALKSDQIAQRTVANWPSDHWRKDHRPLVVLNACGTAEIVQTTMSSFVKNFAGAGASGVVGTETMIDQPTASEAMQHFLREFARGATVSEALRYSRWKLLARGSLLGLTYSPYCSATLRLRTT